MTQPNQAWIADLLTVSSSVPPVFVMDLPTIVPKKPTSGATRAKIFVDGYSSVGDGGRGTFHWDASYGGPASAIDIYPLGSSVPGAWRRELGAKNSLSVLWFGASANPNINGAKATANRLACQACIDYAILNNIGEVVFPVDPKYPASGNYNIDGGLFVYAPLRVTAEQRSGTGLHMGLRLIDNQAGNLMACKSLYVGTNPPAPTLTTESGDTLMTMGPTTYFNALQPPFVSLSENPGAHPVINGLSQFTLEVLLDANNVSSGSPTQWVIAASSGAIDTATLGTMAFMLYWNPAGGNQVAGYLNTGSGPVLFVSSLALPASGKTILVVQYDGAHVSLYQGAPGTNATRGLFQAQTGNISQQYFEEFCLGIEPSAPGASSIAADSRGPWLLGWARVSNTARYVGTTPLLPATAPTQDANTLALYRGFDSSNTIRTGFLQGYYSSNLFTCYRIHGTLGPSYTNNIEIDHLTTSTGITAWLTLTSHYHHLNVASLDFDMFCYMSNVDHILTTPSAASGPWNWTIGVLNGTAFFTATNIQAAAGTWGIVSVYGGNFFNCWIVNYGATNVTKSFYYFGGVSEAPVLCLDCEGVDNSASPMDPAGTGVKLYNQDNIKFHGAVYCSTGGESIPVFQIDSCKEVELSGECSVFSNSVPVISFAAPNTIPVRVSLTQLGGTNRALVDTAHPGLITSAKQAGGSSTCTFTSNATFTMGTSGTSAVNDFFAHRIIAAASGGFPSTPQNFVIPYAVAGYSFIFDNETTQVLTVKTPSGTGIAVAAGKRAWLSTDGTNVIRDSLDAS